jgi:hypothetical protein
VKETGGTSSTVGSVPPLYSTTNDVGGDMRMIDCNSMAIFAEPQFVWESEKIVTKHQPHSSIGPNVLISIAWLVPIYTAILSALRSSGTHPIG